MKVAIVGSRSLVVLHLEDYLPAGITEIVSGGAVGVDTCAKRYAQAHGIALRNFCRITKLGAGARRWCGICRSLITQIWLWLFGTKAPMERNLSSIMRGEPGKR